MMRDLAAGWPFWALAAAGFAALTAIFAKLGVSDLDPDFATLIRTLVILALVAAITVFGGHWRDPAGVPARSWLFLLLSGVATGLSWLCYFRALKLGDASRVAPLDKLSIVLVALFAAIFLGERLSSVNWLGLAMIAGGAILLSIRV